MITIGLAPEFQVGPFTASWHGLAAGIGLVIGMVAATIEARRRGLATEPILTIGVIAGVAGFIGARLYYVAQAEPSAFLRPWRIVTIGTQGYAVYGSVLLAVPAIALWLHRNELPVAGYLDICALAFLPATAVARVGDLIIGERYGPPTGLPWGCAT